MPHPIGVVPGDEPHCWTRHRAAMQLDAFANASAERAEAICSGDAPRVKAPAKQLTALVVNLPAGMGRAVP